MKFKMFALWMIETHHQRVPNSGMGTLDGSCLLKVVKHSSRRNNASKNKNKMSDWRATSSRKPGDSAAQDIGVFVDKVCGESLV